MYVLFLNTQDKIVIHFNLLYISCSTYCQGKGIPKKA